VAERLIRRNKAAEKLLGDKAYDSAELREWLEDRGTKAVIPNKRNRKQPFNFNKKAYKERRRIENAFWLETSSHPSASSQLSSGGFYESGP